MLKKKVLQIKLELLIKSHFKFCLIFTAPVFLLGNTFNYFILGFFLFSALHTVKCWKDKWLGCGHALHFSWSHKSTILLSTNQTTSQSITYLCQVKYKQSNWVSQRTGGSCVLLLSLSYRHSSSLSVKVALSASKPLRVCMGVSS